MHTENLYFIAQDNKNRIIKGEIEIAGEEVNEDVGTENPKGQTNTAGQPGAEMVPLLNVEILVILNCRGPGKATDPPSQKPRRPGVKSLDLCKLHTQFYDLCPSNSDAISWQPVKYYMLY